MNVRLHNLIVEAETRLDTPAQERLSDLVESFVETAAAGDAFTKAELDRLKEIDKAPFDAAPDADVSALFARRA